MLTETSERGEAALATVLSEEAFWPASPRDLDDTGLSVPLLEALACKYLSVVGSSSGRGISSGAAVRIIASKGASSGQPA